MNMEISETALMTHFHDPREIYNPAARASDIARKDTYGTRQKRRGCCFPSSIEEKLRVGAMHARTREGNYALDRRAIMNAD